MFVSNTTTVNIGLLGTTYCGMASVAKESSVCAVVGYTGKIRKLGIHIPTNPRTGAGTIRVRKNTGNGNQAISIGGGQTGFLESASADDDIAAGDEICASITAGSGTGDMYFNGPWCEVETTGDHYTTMASAYQQAEIASASTYYWPIGGTTEYNSSESDKIKLKVQAPGTLSRLFAQVWSNSCDGAVTLSIKGAATTNLSCSIPAGKITGSVCDVTNSDAIAVGNNICIKGVSGGTTGICRISMMGATFKGDDATHWDLFKQCIYQRLAATTWYLSPFGRQSAETVEANSQIQIPSNMKASHLRAYFDAAGNYQTIRTRINGGNGGQSITTNGNQGWFTDVSGSDNLVAGDKLCYEWSSTNSVGVYIRSVAMLMGDDIAASQIQPYMVVVSC